MTQVQNANQASLPAVAMNTIFLVDWDDTLLPTSALQGQCAPNETMQSMMADIDGAATQVLEAALSVRGSDVTLLTNACLDWVWTSSKSHLPQVHTILRSGRVSVVSAHRPLPPCPVGQAGETQAEREIRQAQHTKSSVEWKDAKVRGPLARRLRGRLERTQKQFARQQAPTSDLPAFQVVAIGDATHDLEAGKTLGQLLKSPATDEVAWVKTVQMKSAPNAPELLAQLQVLAQMLPALARRQTSLECSMCRKPSTPPQCATKPPMETCAVQASERDRPGKFADKGKGIGADLGRTCAADAALAAAAHTITTGAAVAAAA